MHALCVVWCLTADGLCEDGVVRREHLVLWWAWGERRETAKVKSSESNSSLQYIYEDLLTGR